MRWDITYLRADQFEAHSSNLYLIVDVWSRKIVGLYRSPRRIRRNTPETSSSKRLHVEGVDSGEACLHADNGGPMKGSRTAL